MEISAGDLLELKKKVDKVYGVPMEDDEKKYRLSYQYKPFNVRDSNGLHPQEGIFTNIRETGDEVTIIMARQVVPVGGIREISKTYPKDTELVFPDNAAFGRRKHNIRGTRRRKIRRTRHRKSRHRRNRR